MRTALRVMLVALIVIAAVAIPLAFGHGVGYETLPPQILGDRKVAMEVNSNVDNATGRRQITFSLFDTNTGLTIRDVKYHIQTIKNNQVLFEDIFDAKNGILTLDLMADKSEKITVMEKSGGGFFDTLIGSSRNSIEVKGNIFKAGGLYKFTIDILQAENYSKERNKAVTFEAGISFPESTVLEINDLHYGRQQIKAITYYELLTSLNYDAKTKSIEFSMPFEWTRSNINQTLVIHQEVAIPKTFAALQVSEYGATINGMVLPSQSITVDDFGKDNRLIHLLVYQSELLKLYEKQQNKSNKMDFAIFPKSDDLLLVASTDNVQYKIALTTNQKQISDGNDAVFLFKIYDIFLAEKTVSTSFDLFIESDDKTLYQTRGHSLDKDQWNEIKFQAPNGIEEILLRFENLGENKLARAEIPIILNTKQGLVPPWIKNNAKWWCENSISDNDFLIGIEYLIAQNVMQIDTTPQNTQSKQIPAWVKTNSCWWAGGSISDAEFVNGIAFLVKEGIIKP